MPKTEELVAAVRVLQAVAETIRDLGSVPNGHFYVRLCEGIPGLTLTTYNNILQQLKNCDLIRESGNILSWSGPKIVPRPFQTA